MLLMRNKIYTFVRAYDKYTGKLKKKLSKLESENTELRKWKTQ